jgi:hypothetical protein
MPYLREGDVSGARRRFFIGPERESLVKYDQNRPNSGFDGFFNQTGDTRRVFVNLHPELCKRRKNTPTENTLGNPVNIRKPL